MGLRKWVLLLICFALQSGLANAQEFISGIHLYNRAEYDSLIMMVPGFIEANPREEGLARYFYAESYYNKALTDTDDDQVRTFLEQAWEEFKLAIQSPDLRRDFTEYYFYSKYKIGWCSYRLAELDADPEEKFLRAHGEFMSFSPEAPDSIKMFSTYMAAESKVKGVTAAFLKYLDEEGQPATLDEILNSQAAMQTLYRHLLEFKPDPSSPHHLAELQALVAVKQEQLKFAFAKFYQALSLQISDSAEVVNKANEHRDLCLSLLRDLKVASLFEHRPEIQKRWSSTLAYLDLNRHLNTHFLTRSSADREAFMRVWRRTSHPDLAVARLFRRANLLHSHPDAEGVEFNDLAVAFYDSARAEPESDYWLGYLQMVQGAREHSRQRLDSFLRLELAERRRTRRQQILLEDARYRKYLLDFEATYLAGDTRKLRELVADLQRFAPQNRTVRNRTEQLNLLANSSVTRNPDRIWSEVLTGTDEEKLQLTLATIRFFLPRTALNIGRTRERYIKLLHRLFRITELRLRDDTRFFQGIVQSLEAEIQETLFAKMDKFLVAAQTMRAVRDGYENKSEADYVRARCLFFADEFEAAAEILIRLINEKKYLRAVFYLAEIFRLDNNGRAAKKCYETIIHKLQQGDYLYDEFWLANATAGIESSDDSGSLAVLDSIRIATVEFQPARHPDLLTYELLAEEKFLKSKFARESVEWLMQFGLPQKEFYPSQHHLQNTSLAHENYFARTPYALDELRRAVTSALHLQVVLPGELDSEVQVKLGDELLQEKGGIYVKTFIPLNAELQLSITNAHCYEFKESYVFDKPGLDKKTVLLSKKLEFVVTNKGQTVMDDFDYAFAPRWDDNYVLNTLPVLAPDSQLRLDFENLIELRDCALDRAGNRILAVNAQENALWTYSNKFNSTREGILSLSLEPPLKSPEGIAVNSSGHIYIVDWGNHRIVQCNGDGEVVRVLGSAGRNSPDDVGQQIRLTYPTRIAIVEQGQESAESRARIRQDFLYIADQHGIHICKPNGVYLDTLVPPSADFPTGSFYGFSTSGFGAASRLYLLKRLSGVRGRVVEFVAR